MWPDTDVGPRLGLLWFLRDTDIMNPHLDPPVGSESVPTPWGRFRRSRRVWQISVLLRRSGVVAYGCAAPLHRARGHHVRIGQALRRANQRAEARELLREGLELAQRCGAAPLAQRAHAELLATGARPRRLVRTGVDSLTPSEHRVAQMAAEGQTNREIAQALFVTPKTIEMHLSHVYGKLDIQSRTQLATAMATPRGAS